MRSKKVGFRVPWQVYELAEERADALGYRNVGRYFLGMAIADCFLSGWGARMRNIANSDPDVQDFLVEQIMHLPVEQIELAAFLKRLVPGIANAKPNGNGKAKPGNGKKPKKKI